MSSNSGAGGHVVVSGLSRTTRRPSAGSLGCNLRDLPALRDTLERKRPRHPAHTRHLIADPPHITDLPHAPRPRPDAGDVVVAGVELDILLRERAEGTGERACIHVRPDHRGRRRIETTVRVAIRFEHALNQRSVARWHDITAATARGASAAGSLRISTGAATIGLSVAADEGATGRTLTSGDGAGAETEPSRDAGERGDGVAGGTARGTAAARGVARESTAGTGSIAGWAMGCAGADADGGAAGARGACDRHVSGHCRRPGAAIDESIRQHRQPQNHHDRRRTFWRIHRAGRVARRRAHRQQLLEVPPAG